MSRTGQVAAVASAAAVLGAGYWYGTLDDSTSTSVAASTDTAAATTATTTAATAAASTATTAGATSTTAGATSGTSTTSATAAKSGSYTGSTETDKYGDLTVTVTLSSGKISNVTYTSTASDGHSLSIESMATPTLKSEAIAANSADIATVSGATYTSTKYKASLQSALDKA